MSATPLRTRELYCPGHFGNSYEVAMHGEMSALLSEARLWGFTRYSDWFDTIDLKDLYASTHGLCNTPEATWDRKLGHFGVAQALGFDLGLVVTPNHVFLDQVTPETAATLRAPDEPGPRLFGQLVCPSKPGVVEMILGNYRNLLGSFAERGLVLGSISAGAYDYGGCACDACQPWIVTCAQLARRIVEVGREVFPDVAAELWGWWWTDADHEAVSAWAAAEAPGEIAAVAHHVLYGETGYAPRRVPAGADERAFINIGYGEVPGIDVYGHYGPSIAPERIERTVAFLRDVGADGFLAYSEGQCDELNKALIAGLASGQFSSADEVLEAYAERHLGGDAAGWAAWLRSMGDVDAVDAGTARARFDRLRPGARQTPRLRALEEKLRMVEADRAVQGGGAWDVARRQAATDFWDAKERLWRQVWGLGLGRHALKFDWKVPGWHAEYAALGEPGSRWPGARDTDREDPQA